MMVDITKIDEMANEILKILMKHNPKQADVVCALALVKHVVTINNTNDYLRRKTVAVKVK